MKKLVMFVVMVFALVSCVTIKEDPEKQRVIQIIEQDYTARIENYINGCERFLKNGGYMKQVVDKPKSFLGPDHPAGGIFSYFQHRGEFARIQDYPDYFHDYKNLMGFGWRREWYRDRDRDIIRMKNEISSIYRQYEERLVDVYNRMEESLAAAIVYAHFLGLSEN